MKSGQAIAWLAWLAPTPLSIHAHMLLFYIHFTASCIMELAI